jgi:hypothetical protein
MALPQFQMHVPLDVLQTPRTGECIVGAFWMVHPEKGALYVLDRIAVSYRDGVREVYNMQEEVTRRFLVADHEVRQIPVAYLSHGKSLGETFRQKIGEQLR